MPFIYVDMHLKTIVVVTLFIPVVHTLFMAMQSTFYLEPEEPLKVCDKNGRVTAIFSYKNH